MQNHYNLLYREEEREMFPTLKVTLFQLLFGYWVILIKCQLLGVGSIPWSPLARGLLTRPMTDHDQTKRGTTDW
jgi:aryl-alcohol dehydrogenase-like predicted oxidoreductase